MKSELKHLKTYNLQVIAVPMFKGRYGRGTLNLSSF